MTCPVVHNHARLVGPKSTRICDEFGGVTNHEGDLTLVVSGECPGDNGELS